MEVELWEEALVSVVVATKLHVEETVLVALWPHDYQVGAHYVANAAAGDRMGHLEIIHTPEWVNGSQNKIVEVGLLDFVNNTNK